MIFFFSFSFSRPCFCQSAKQVLLWPCRNCTEHKAKNREATEQASKKESERERAREERPPFTASIFFGDLVLRVTFIGFNRRNSTTQTAKERASTARRTRKKTRLASKQAAEQEALTDTHTVFGAPFVLGKDKQRQEKVFRESAHTKSTEPHKSQSEQARHRQQNKQRARTNRTALSFLPQVLLRKAKEAASFSRFSAPESRAPNTAGLQEEPSTEEQTSLEVTVQSTQKGEQKKPPVLVRSSFERQTVHQLLPDLVPFLPSFKTALSQEP